jgi:hypothetical protein
MTATSLSSMLWTRRGDSDVARAVGQRVAMPLRELSLPRLTVMDTADLRTGSQLTSRFTR